MSGSQPDGKYRMLARDARMRLDTEEARFDTLTKHANHGTWEDTPYISFTNSPGALQDLAESRMRNRGDQSIVVVDPRIRIEIGLPVLHYKEEMEHYRIQSPYTRNYWDGHYLCLWEVTPEEVVGVWKWNELRNKQNWFAEIILPAVEAQRKKRDRYQVEDNDSPKKDVNDRFSADASVGLENSDAIDDAGYDERVVEENWTGQLMKMYEDLKLE